MCASITFLSHLRERIFFRILKMARKRKKTWLISSFQSMSILSLDALDRFSLETGPPLQLEYANKGGEETISLTISTDFDSVAGPSPDFSRHTLVRPRVYHGRTRRQISSTKENVSTILFSRKEILFYSRQHIRAPL